MINDEILLENDYKKFIDIFNSAECLFQKRIRNEKGQTKYFINIYKYIHNDKKAKYEVSLQFEKDRYTMNINIFAIDSTMTLEEIEKEVYSIWYGLDCKYYDCKVE